MSAAKHVVLSAAKDLHLLFASRSGAVVSSARPGQSADTAGKTASARAMDTTAPLLESSTAMTTSRYDPWLEYATAVHAPSVRVRSTCIRVSPLHGSGSLPCASGGLLDGIEGYLKTTMM
jgi:hypothetical protein